MASSSNFNPGVKCKAWGYKDLGQNPNDKHIRDTYYFQFPEEKDNTDVYF